jgi:hypothetical protein
MLAAGAALGLAGLAGAVVFGPDDTVTSGPHRYSSTGSAVVTTPEAIAYSGPTVTVTAAAADGAGRVFVGVAHDVDVRDYLAGSAYTAITEVRLPWRTTTQKVHGAGSPDTAPGSRDWWLVDATAPRSASVTLRLPDAAVDVVVMDPRRRPDFAADLTVAVSYDGVFAASVAALVVGAGALVAGWGMRARRPQDRAAAGGRP